MAKRRNFATKLYIIRPGMIRLLRRNDGNNIWFRNSSARQCVVVIENFWTINEYDINSVVPFYEPARVPLHGRGVDVRWKIGLLEYHIEKPNANRRENRAGAVP